MRRLLLVAVSFVGLAGCGFVALVAGCVLVCVRAPDVPADEPVAPA